MGPRIQLVPRERASSATATKMRSTSAGSQVAPRAIAAGKLVAPFCMKPCTPSSITKGGMPSRLFLRMHDRSSSTNFTVSATPRQRPMRSTPPAPSGRISHSSAGVFLTDQSQT